MSNNTIFNFQRPRTITSQLRAPSDASVASSSDLNNRDTIEALPQAIWNNRRFVCDDSLATKGSRGRRTWIRNEGLFVREILPDGRKGKAYWVCRRCDERHDLKLFDASSTSSASSHLKIKHRVLPLAVGEKSEAADAVDDLPPPPKRYCSAPVAIP
ncbi:transposase-like protein, partial [Colletotrichum plurivorum]